MQRDQIPIKLSEISFEFFFMFSRFEFALKENKYLKSEKVGAKAEPDWIKFVSRWEKDYISSSHAKKLVELAPKTQVVAEKMELSWRPTVFPEGSSELYHIVHLLKTVRNNLFHGGKHGEETWGNAERMLELLSVALPILLELAKVADIEADYTGYY